MSDSSPWDTPECPHAILEPPKGSGVVVVHPRGGTVNVPAGAP
jgi:hypothetical protein